MKGLEPSTFCMANRLGVVMLSDNRCILAFLGRYRQVRFAYSGTKFGTNNVAFPEHVRRPPLHDPPGTVHRITSIANTRSPPTAEQFNSTVQRTTAVRRPVQLVGGRVALAGVAQPIA
jgi:hypothetical protein